MSPSTRSWDMNAARLLGYAILFLTNVSPGQGTTTVGSITSTPDVTSSVTTYVTTDNPTIAPVIIPDYGVASLDDCLSAVPQGCNASLISWTYLAQDYGITVSSLENGYNPYTTLLVNPPPGADTWCAKSGDSNPMISFRFQQKLVISEVSIRGGDTLNEAWLGSFRLSFNKDRLENGSESLYYPDDTGNKPKIFTANNDSTTVAAVTLMPAIFTDTLTIHAVTWNNTVCVNLNITGCAPNICNKHELLPGESIHVGEMLCTEDGLAYGRMTLSGLEVSNKAERKVFYSALNASLLLNATLYLGLVEANSTVHYLYEANNIVKLAFTSDGNLCLSNDGGYAVWCSHPGGIPGHKTTGPRCSSLIRGYPASEVFVASSVSAESEDSVNYTFFDTPNIPYIQRGGWCPDKGDTAHYLEIHLPRRSLVHAIAVQTCEVKLGSSFAVTKYDLYYKERADMTQWTRIYYETSPNAFYKDFNGPPNDVANNYTLSYFTDALFAEVFKLIPVQWMGYPCLRVDVLQCQDNKVAGNTAYYNEEGIYAMLEDDLKYLTDTSTTTCKFLYVHPTMPEMIIELSKVRLITGFNFYVGLNDSWSAFDVYVSDEKPNAAGELPPNSSLCVSVQETVRFEPLANQHYNCTTPVSGRYVMLDVLDDVIKIELCRFRAKSASAVVSRRKPVWYRHRWLYFTKQTDDVTDGIRSEPCFSGPIQDNPALYVDLGQDTAVSAVVLTNYGAYDDLAGVYVALLPSTISSEVFFYVWKADLRAFAVCARIDATFAAWETRTIQCNGGQLYGRYIVLMRLANNASLSLCQMEVFDNRTSTNSLQMPDFDSGWKQFNLAGSADVVSKILYNGASLPTYFRALVSTSATITKDTFVFEGSYSNQASAAICDVSIYYTDTEIWIIRPKKSVCLSKYLCRGSSQWVWRGQPDHCPHDKVYIKVQTWQFCTLTPDYRSTWKDIYIKGQTGLPKAEFSYDLGAIPKLCVAQLQINGTSGGVYYTQAYGSSSLEQDGIVYYTNDTVTVNLIDGIISLINADLNETEADFAAAKISVRVFLWIDLEAFPQTWTINDVNSSSPNIIQLPGEPPELALIIAQTEMINTTDGSVYYLNGPILPYTPFYDGFLYTIKDYKLILWWNIRNSGHECIIKTVTFYYYHLGQQISTSCTALSVANSTLQDVCAATGRTVTGMCYGKPTLTTSQTCTATDWDTNNECIDKQWTLHTGIEYLYNPASLPVADAEALCEGYGAHLLGADDITEMEFIITSLMDPYAPDWSVHFDLTRTLIQLSRLSEFWSSNSNLNSLTLVLSDVLSTDNYTASCAILSLKSGNTVNIEEVDCATSNTIVCKRPVCLGNEMSYLTYDHREWAYTPTVTYTSTDTEWQETICIQTCSANDSCVGYTYSGYTGQCQMFNMNYTPPSVPDMYEDYYMVVSSAIKACDPANTPLWSLVYATADVARLSNMTSLNSLSVSSGVMEAPAMYPLDIKPLGVNELQTYRYVSSDSIYKVLLTVTDDSGSTRYIAFDMKNRLSTDPLQVTDIVLHNLNTTLTSMSQALTTLTSGLSNYVTALYANAGCSFKHPPHTKTQYDLDLRWTDWLAFSVLRTTCYWPADVDVSLNDGDKNGRAIMVTFGSQGNTLVYFRIWNNGYAAHTQTMVIQHSPSCKSPNHYWLSWKDKVLEFGTGERRQLSTRLHHQQLDWDPKYNIKNLEINSRGGAEVVFFREFPCKPVTLINTTSPILRAEGNCVKTVTCLPGHGLPDHNTSYTTECLSNGLWSVVQPCLESVDGVWSEWSNWTECSVTCGNGTQTRNRTCHDRLNAGQPCQGDSVEYLICVSETQPLCDVDGVWSNWTEWTNCSATCENGTRSRSRTCEGRMGNGANCTGDWVEVEICMLQPICNRDGFWTAWSEWSSCDVTCGTGVIARTRSCEGIIGDGANCTGDPGFVETSPCNGSAGACPVTVTWQDWSSWSECDSYCGDGNWTRTRKCVAVTPDGSSRPADTCLGPDQQTESCFTAIHSGCDVDGEWTDWSAWSVCSATCDGGTRYRTRDCVGQQNNGSFCAGNKSESAVCGTGICSGSSYRVDCPDFMELPHGTHDGDSLLTGTVVHYYCLQHYEFPRRVPFVTTECTRFAEWDPGTLPPCQLKKCKRPQKTRGTWWSTDDFSHGSLLLLGCRPGYLFPDGSDRSYSVCDEPHWTHTVPSCQLKTCDIPPLNNTEPYPNILTYGQMITVRCRDGYLFPIGRPLMELYCTSTGSLNVQPGHCQDFHCLPPPIIINASAEFINDLTVAVTCLPGHRYPDGYNIKYMNCIDGHWQPETLPACKVITCPPVPYVEHGTPNTTNAIFGTTASYTCDLGYKFPDNKSEFSVHCKEDASWSSPVVSCILMVCASNPVVAYTSDNGTSAVDYPVFTYIQYECTGSGTLRFPDGYLTKLIQCTLQETWSMIPDPCEENVCPPVPILPHAVPNTTLARMGTVVSLECEEGFEKSIKNENYTIVCTEDLAWTESSNYCTATYCPAIVKPHLLRSSLDTIYASVVDVSCQYGYVLHNNTESITLQCMADGNWNVSLDEINCQVRRCPTPLKINHGTANDTNNVWTTVINYQCKTGFWFSDRTFSKNMECLGDGAWSWQAEDCKLVTCPSLPTWDALIIDNTALTWTTVVNCSCEEGYQLEEYNTTSILTTCTSSGLWLPDVPPCVVINKTRVVIPTTEAPKAMDIGAVALTLMLTTFGLVVLLDVATVGPSTFRMAKVHARGWKAAVMAIKYRDPRVAPNPLLGKAIKFVNQKMQPKSAATTDKQDLEMETLTESNMEDNVSRDADVTSNDTNQTTVDSK